MSSLKTLDENEFAVLSVRHENDNKRITLIRLTLDIKDYYVIPKENQNITSYPIILASKPAKRFTEYVINRLAVGANSNWSRHLKFKIFKSKNSNDLSEEAQCFFELNSNNEPFPSINGQKLKKEKAETVDKEDALNQTEEEDLNFIELSKIFGKLNFSFFIF